MPTLVYLAGATGSDHADWWSRHSTLIVGLAGIVMSGFIGPSVTAWFTAKRERTKDARARVADERDDLRELLDDAAKVLGGAVSNLRPLLDAQQSRRDAPAEPAEFLGTLFPLGQRLRLRLPEGDPVLQRYDEVRGELVHLSSATGSQAEWDAAVTAFEDARARFLDAGREAVHAPITEDPAA
jgi:hypothetical protein